MILATDSWDFIDFVTHNVRKPPTPNKCCNYIPNNFLLVVVVLCFASLCWCKILTRVPPPNTKLILDPQSMDCLWQHWESGHSKWHNILDFRLWLPQFWHSWWAEQPEPKVAASYESYWWTIDLIDLTPNSFDPLAVNFLFLMTKVDN
jgi:hypothetical protein